MEAPEKQPENQFSEHNQQPALKQPEWKNLFTPTRDVKIFFDYNFMNLL